MEAPASNIERKSWQNKVGVNKEDTDSCQKTLICAAEISNNNKKVVSTVSFCKAHRVAGQKATELPTA